MNLEDMSIEQLRELAVRQEKELKEQQQIAQAANRQAEEARAELEEWRFTNKIDELQREVDRYRAQAQSPVAYSVTYDGEVTNNIFLNVEAAQNHKDRLDSTYEGVRTVLPLYAAPQQHAQPLPKWIDNEKGKDPLIDDLIAYIEGIHPSQQHAQAALSDGLPPLPRATCGDHSYSGADMQAYGRACIATRQPAPVAFVPGGAQALADTTGAPVMYGEQTVMPKAAPVAIEQDRADFEDWYSSHARDIKANPIGSRECALQWSAWLAGSSGNYRAPSDWKVAPQPWGIDGAALVAAAVQGDAAPASSKSSSVPEKAIFWLSCLTKCARLLNLPDEEPIPSGVVKAVEKIAAQRDASQDSERDAVLLNLDQVNLIIDMIIGLCERENGNGIHIDREKEVILYGVINGWEVVEEYPGDQENFGSGYPYVDCIWKWVRDYEAKASQPKKG